MNATGKVVYLCEEDLRHNSCLKTKIKAKWIKGLNITSETNKYSTKFREKTALIGKDFFLGWEED
jgi:hypothetical protein